MLSLTTGQLETWLIQYFLPFVRIGACFLMAPVFAARFVPARVRLLLEMFPDARFIHLHRDPFTVFQSTRRMLDRFCATQTLQKPDPAMLDERVFRQFNEMYDAFFAERPLIPAGQFHEIAFEAQAQRAG